MFAYLSTSYETYEKLKIILVIIQKIYKSILQNSFGNLPLYKVFIIAQCVTQAYKFLIALVKIYAVL